MMEPRKAAKPAGIDNYLRREEKAPQAQKSTAETTPARRKTTPRYTRPKRRSNIIRQELTTITRPTDKGITDLSVIGVIDDPALFDMDSGAQRPQPGSSCNSVPATTGEKRPAIIVTICNQIAMKIHSDGHRQPFICIIIPDNAAGFYDSIRQAKIITASPGRRHLFFNNTHNSKGFKG